jgi:catechol 2,3-dioxygenase-like lactoylglutathione lyase family enzyme
MAIELDHVIVSSRDSRASAQKLAELLGVPWGPAAAGPFTAVYVNDGLTLDFIDTEGDFPVEHFCFRVSPAEFDAILGRIRAAGIPYRSAVRGPVDMRVHPQLGNVYWNDPDGHQWEMLIVSYARQVR